MESFNKIFKSIILQNEFYVQSKFPQGFTFSDYGLEFIFNIMPTFGPNYQWRTLEDIQNIPELIQTLQNTQQSILVQISDGFQQLADSEQEAYPNEQFTQTEQYRKIADWIRSLNTPTEEITQSDDINIHDRECFNTVPNVVKQVRPRAYRRGLKALSIPNRKKFNKSMSQASASQFIEPIETDISKTETDILNKVKSPKIVQQPISKSVIKPMPGVNRPLGLDRTQKKIKTTFANMVYNPSITQIAKQNAKKRCIAARKAKSLCKQDTDLEFTTDYSQPVKPYVKPDPIDPADDTIKKELCIICKEYVQPREVTLKNGKTVYECPKCGLRITKKNY